VTSFTEKYHELSKCSPPALHFSKTMHWEQRYPSIKCYGDVPSLPFSGKKLDFKAPYGSFEFLRCLLHCAGGVLPKTEETKGFAWRACISVAAAYPTEMFVLVRHVDAPSGLFYFDVDSEKLLKIAELKEAEQELSRAFADDSVFSHSRITLFCTSMLDRCAFRLREAAYRIALLDAGAVFGNVVNFSRALGCPVVPLGGFVDSVWSSTFRLSSGEIPVAAFAIDPELHGYIPDAVPSLDPFVAREMLWLDVSSSLLLCQNQAERIPENVFRKRVPKNYFFVEDSDAIALPSALNMLQDFQKDPKKWSRMSYHFKSFSKKSISLNSFSGLISAAVREHDAFFSAGFLKCYVLIFHVDGLEPGLYRYESIRHLLQPLNKDVSEKLWQEAHIIPEQAENTAFSFIYAADLAMVTNVLGDRGYRYLLLDSGIINASLHLFSKLLHLKTKGEYGYYEDFLKKVIGLDAKDSILYESMVGVPKKN